MKQIYKSKWVLDKEAELAAECEAEYLAEHPFHRSAETNELLIKNPILPAGFLMLL